MPTKQQIIRQLAIACDDLVVFPGGNRNSLLRRPYQGVLQGITIEGSPEGYAWRVVVFAFVPLIAASSLVLSRVPDFEIWWDGRDGSLMNGDACLAKFVGDCSNIQTCVAPLYEEAYRPWLAQRDTASLLLSALPVPQPLVTQGGQEVWTPNKVFDAVRYALVSVAADDLQGAEEVLKAVECNSPGVDVEGVRAASVVHLVPVEEILNALRLAPIERRAWVQERENNTFTSLKLTREFVENLH